MRTCSKWWGYLVTLCEAGLYNATDHESVPCHQDRIIRILRRNRKLHRAFIYDPMSKLYTLISHAPCDRNRKWVSRGRQCMHVGGR